ncbi:hypothetical protein D3C85_1648840 [compost metagenome]
MQNTAQATELRVSRTDGVVYSRVRMCGRLAVPSIRQNTSSTKLSRLVFRSASDAAG